MKIALNSLKKIHGNIADYKIFVTFAPKSEKMNNY